MNLALFHEPSAWEWVTRCDLRARDLADRHYSRQTVGARDFTPPGRTLVLVTPDGRAVWAAVENMDPIGGRRWRCTIFRNEGPALSSLLVRDATTRTFAYWSARGWVPGVPLTTEINPEHVRRKRDPGRCFLRAGWIRVDERRGLVVLQAPTS